MIWPYLCFASIAPLIATIVFGVLLAKTDVFTVPSSIVAIDACVNECYPFDTDNICITKIFGTFMWQYENVSYSQRNFSMDSVRCKQICCNDAVNKTGSMQINKEIPSVAEHFFDDGVIPFHTTYQALMITSVSLFIVLFCAAAFACLVDERNKYQSLS